MEESDIFLLLCGAVPGPVRPMAVITKNLSDFLQEIFAGVNYLRERFPRLEAELVEALAKIDRQAKQLITVNRALDDQKEYSLELHHNVNAMYYSRTWQLMLACREALRSPLKTSAAAVPNPVFHHEARVEAGGFRDGLDGQDDWNFWITLGANGCYSTASTTPACGPTSRWRSESARLG